MNDQIQQLQARIAELEAENKGLQVFAAGHQRTLERCLDLKAECAELEAMLDAVGAGGVGESIHPQVQPDTAPATPQPTENLNCKSTQKRLATLWGYVKQESARQPLTDQQIMELAEPFGAFEYGDAQGHKRQAFVRAIEEAVWKQNS